MASDLSHRRLWEILALALLVAMMALLMLALSPAQRAYAAPGNIEGNVTGADDGDPIANATVTAYDASGVEAGSATTNSDGDYTLIDLPAPASYRLLFEADDGEHTSIYYLDRSKLELADPVEVPDGGVVLGIDQAIPLGGSITGIVRGGDDSQPLAFCLVKIYKVTWRGHQRIAELLGDTLTSVGGSYRFQGLPAGGYLIESCANDLIHSVTWWWDGKATETSATSITVDLGVETTHIDLDVPAGGKISGSVTDTAGGDVQGASCVAYIYNSKSESYEQVTSISSGAGGIYEIGPVTPGSYRMGFTPPSNAWLGEYYNNKPNLEQATTFKTHTGQETTNINAVLTRTATMKGLVRSDEGKLVPGCRIELVTVNAYRKVGSKWELGYSGKTLRNEGDPNSTAWGTYEIKGIAPGTYVVEFVPDRIFWNKRYSGNKPDKQTAEQIVLSDGEIANNVNVLLTWATSKMEKFAVTPEGSSDFGALLSSVGFGYNTLSLDISTSFDVMNVILLKKFKIVFINCSGQFASDYENLEDSLGPPYDPTNSPLVQYVTSGGKLIVSDCSQLALMRDFAQVPEVFTFEEIPEQGQKQSMTATVVDDDMRKALGSSTVPITYDVGGTVVLTGICPTGTRYMRANVKTDLKGTVLNAPICASVPIGSGTLIYQTFHLDKQSADVAKNILYFFTGGRPSPPRITSVSPTSGAVGDRITIKGSNFGTKKVSSSWVRFNNMKATKYYSWSTTEISARVPSGALTGPLSVTTGGGTSNKVTFQIREAPEGTQWYLAEGSTAYGFDTYITIENPNSEQVTAQVEYNTTEGPVRKEDIALPGYSQTTFNPRDDLGEKDFSTKVTCVEGDQIAVDRRMIWTGRNAPSQEGHSSIGVTTTSEKWYLAEGSSKWGFECWLLVQNPNNQPVTLLVTYMIEGEDPVQKSKTVLANSRATWSMAEDIGEKDASVMIESIDARAPIIAERAMYRFDRREGHESIGTSAPAKVYYLAEGTTGWGFTTYVLIQNPNSKAADVTLTYMTSGGPKKQPAFTLPANSRKTVRVNDIPDMQNQDFSTRIAGSLPIIAERAMYWGAETPLGEACHNSIGMSSAHTTFFLPDGETRNGYETWTLVQNPNEESVDIEITYYEPGGTKQIQPIPDTIRGNSRKTYNMADKIKDGKAAICVTCRTPGLKIMVERAMYWNSRGAGANTIGGFSDEITP